MILLNAACETIFTQLKDKSIDLIVTDPPYNFTEAQKLTYHLEMLRVCKGTVIVFAPPENQWIFPADQYLFWTKPISTKNTSKAYSRFVEMIFVYRTGVWNTGRHWSQYVNIFNDFVDVADHPYKKPPSLIKRLILNHSNPDDVVFDPFMGSGVVGQVCLDEGRRFTGCEIDKLTFDATSQLLLKKIAYMGSV
jgi:DNA modification methylase